MSELQQISQWPVDTVAGALIHSGESIDTVGDTSRQFPVASVTKLVSAYAVMMAVEAGAVDLKQPAGPEGTTHEHLLAHATRVKIDSREQQKPV